MRDAPCFHICRPGPPLTSHVEAIWYWRSSLAGHARDRMMPSASASLVINLAEDAIRIYSPDGGRLARTHDGAGFSGACIEPFAIDTAEQVHVAGVTFRPGGAFAFMRHAQDELRDVHAPLRDVWGLELASLRDRLLAQTTPQAIAGTLEQVLRERLTRSPAVHPAVAQMVYRIELDPGFVRIRDVCCELPLSPRRLARLFELAVGVTPKVYARVSRFRLLRQVIHRQPGLDWATAAADCGYYDQSHLVREFKAFSGFTPGEYRRLATGPSDHVPLG